MKIALFQPDIAQNLGAAMRLCACFEVPLIIIEPCGFPLTDKALRRTAMDYAAKVELIRMASWDDFLHNLMGRLVLMTTKSATPITGFRFQPGDVLLFGRESAGVPDEVHARAEARLFIPLAPEARSLNLVSSASIALFEALRQTNTLPVTPARL